MCAPMKFEESSYQGMQDMVDCTHSWYPKIGATFCTTNAISTIIMNSQRRRGLQRCAAATQLRLDSDDSSGGACLQPCTCLSCRKTMSRRSCNATPRNRPSKWNGRRMSGVVASLEVKQGLPALRPLVLRARLEGRADRQCESQTYLD